MTKDGESTTTNILYNDEMQITGYTDNYSTISIIYESGRVVNVKENNGTSTSDPYGLYYNNGIPARLDHYSESYPVTYNSQQNSYTVGDILSFGLKEKDIAYVNSIIEKKTLAMTTAAKDHYKIFLTKIFSCHFVFHVPILLSQHQTHHIYYLNQQW